MASKVAAHIKRPRDAATSGGMAQEKALHERLEA